jgi:hypothetical protein
MNGKKSMNENERISNGFAAHQGIKWLFNCLPLLKTQLIQKLLTKNFSLLIKITKKSRESFIGKSI